MSQIIKSLVTIVAILVLTIGATSAYFTDQAHSIDNVFSSGTIAVELNQQSQIDGSDFKPGDSFPIEFTVTNTGSLPVNLKGFFSGEWSDQQLSLSPISFNQLAYLDDDQWLPVEPTQVSVDQEFFYQADDQLLPLAAGQSRVFRATMQFAQDAGNQYQGAVFTSNLHLAAKQVQAGASWPTEY